MALAKFGGGCMGGPCQGHGGPRSTDEYHTLKLPPEASPGGTPGRAPGGPPEARALGVRPGRIKTFRFYNITPSAVNAIPVNTHTCVSL